MSPEAGLLRWDGDAGALIGAVADGGRGALLAADSWLVDEGWVRGLSRHCLRFVAACRAAAGAADAELLRELPAFLGTVVTVLPRQGRWFPRVELVQPGGGSRLQLRLRPAPALGRSVRLWVGAPDPRRRPEVKGADLDQLLGLREHAIRQGADEAVLLDGRGRLLEGATSSLLWWRDGVLCAPAESHGLLAGVTRGLLFAAVAAEGGRVAEDCPPPALGELDGLEVWAVNALHGIRPVTAWLGAGIAAGPAERAEHWRARLERAAPIDLSETGARGAPRRSNKHAQRTG